MLVIHRKLLLLRTARDTNPIAEAGESWDSYQVCPIIAGKYEAHSSLRDRSVPTIIVRLFLSEQMPLISYRHVTETLPSV